MYLIGLDLGQRRDHSAIVVVQKHLPHPYLTTDMRLLVRLAERIPLGTPYGEVVEMVRKVVRVANSQTYGAGQWWECGLAVDATGLGKPVVEMLRNANLGCHVTAVTITGGDRQHSRSGEGSAVNVPKQDLIAGLQVVLERGELRIAQKLREAGTLTRELMDVRLSRRESGYVRYGADGSGQHDDLVIALALAVWRAKRR